MQNASFMNLTIKKTMWKSEDVLKHQESKAVQSITRLMLLAACTKVQENRFDIPEGRYSKHNRPRHVRK
jgi:hypothetical protein